MLRTIELVLILLGAGMGVSCSFGNKVVWWSVARKIPDSRFRVGNLRCPCPVRQGSGEEKVDKELISDLLWYGVLVKNRSKRVKGTHRSKMSRRNRRAALVMRSPESVTIYGASKASRSPYSNFDGRSREDLAVDRPRRRRPVKPRM
jgi:hypothetical protein